MRAARVKVIVTFPPEGPEIPPRSFEEEMTDCDVDLAMHFELDDPAGKRVLILRASR